LGGLYSLYY